MNNISSLSKGELIKNNENLVNEYLENEGYDLIKILGNNSKTKYKISKNNLNYIIKIMGYRYNPKARGNYAWVKKHNFELNEYNYLFFVLYYLEKVYILKIPVEVFVKPKENSPFKNHDYWNNKKTAPEYGINIERNTIKELLSYSVAESCNFFSLCNN
ncbi:hypothetical protein IJG14_01325 [bacterium]|nr:hypothetical protein [bacterium]